MPPSFERSFDPKRISQIAESVVPEIVKDAQIQDRIIKSVNENAALGVPSEREIVETLKDLQKAVSTEKDAGVAPKSFMYNPMQYSDTANHPFFIRGITYMAMHEMVKQSQILSAIVNTRINQVASFARVPRSKYAIGFNVRRKGTNRMSESEKSKAQFYEDFLINCGVGTAAHIRDYFEQFVKKIARDRLVVDQVNFERVFTMGKKLHEVVAVDSSTVRIALRRYLDSGGYSSNSTALDANVIYDPVTRLNTIAKFQVPDAERAYVQVMNGQTVREFTADEMAFVTAWPRTDVNVAGYGYSEVEQLIQTVTAILFASEYNRRFFSSGSSPKGVLNVKANMNQAQMDGFKKAWLAQLSGISGSWRTPIVAAEGGLEFINMQQTNREMEFSKYNDFLIKVACAVYQIAPEEINFSSQTSATGQGAVFESKSELRLKASRDKGLVPLLTFFENALNREIMRYVDPNYEIVFVGLDGGTELDAVELYEKELKNYKTLNEVRKDNDLPPVEGGDIILNPVYAQIQIANQNIENQQATLQQTQEFQAEQADKQSQMQAEQANSQADNEKKMSKTQMEQEKLSMAHEKQQMKHAQMKHQMDGEKMEREKNAPKDNKAKKKKPLKKGLGEEESNEEWDFGAFDNFEDFAEAVQHGIRSGNFEKSLANVEGPIKVTPAGE